MQICLLVNRKAADAFCYPPGLFLSIVTQKRTGDACKGKAGDRNTRGEISW
jgi:hypothetical protein